MPASFRWKVPLVLGIIALSAWWTFPAFDYQVSSPDLVQKAREGALGPPYEVRKAGNDIQVFRPGKIKLGLDLQGGLHLLLRVKTDTLGPDAAKSDPTAMAVEVIRKRMEQWIDPAGIREPLIQRQGADHILVQIPGVPASEIDRIREVLGRPAVLEFALVSADSSLRTQAQEGAVPPGHELLNDREATPYLLEKEGALTGKILADAWTDVGEMGLPVVRFKLTAEGSKAFARLTGANMGRQLAIVLDQVVQSAPQIQARISGEGVITGNFTKEEATEIARVLQSGALPAPVEVQEGRFVGPTLGKDSIRAGLLATAYGAAFIVLFMIGYYRLAGTIAVGALLLNLLIILGFLGLTQGTLTLPGIAGMILTLGMAVDANVLIYERIREELTAGRPLSLAVDAGYDKAFSAILDSNVTTVIAGVILWWMTTGPLRGFATTLIAGLIASMFTAITVTRLVFDWLLATRRITTLRMASLIGTTRIDFIGKRWLSMGLSGVVIVAGMVAFVRRGPERYGVDFTGGLLQEYRFSAPVTADQLRGTLHKIGINDAVLQQFGSATEWLIRTPDDTPEEVRETKARTHEALQSDYGQPNPPDIIRAEEVGPTVGQSLRVKALSAIAMALVGIMVYVAFRFRHLDFGVAGVIALIHDVVVATGFMALTHRPIDMLTIAALLTIAGFSINDTIVIYDRVREHLRLNRKIRLAEAINLSVNETLSRTLLTSLTVITQVVALYCFGGETLRDFSFCLLVGFISGVYSTVYIASAIVIIWRNALRPTAS